MEQIEIDIANKVFWDELCGTDLAKKIGIKDYSERSLTKFDQAYFDYYPYLFQHIPFNEMKGKKVLEVGLGFGTVGQRIASSGADYIGMDIAKGPVEMMKRRLNDKNLTGKTLQGNILNSSLPSDSFDYVVSIGCYHHTGNIQRCFDETFRLLKKGGTAVVMVYNKFSYLQWKKWPLRTILSAFIDYGCLRQEVSACEEQKHLYDANSQGQAAPETVFVSIRQLKNMLSKFYQLNISKENVSDHYPIHFFLNRKSLLSNVGRILGLDIYLSAKK